MDKKDPLVPATEARYVRTVEEKPKSMTGRQYKPQESVAKS